MKTTKDVVLEYFNAFDKNKGWENLVSNNIKMSSPTGTIKGKEAFIEMTNQFKQLVKTAKVKSIIVEGENASALTSYELVLPTNDKMNLEVAETISVKGQKIDSFEIYFDTVKFNEFIAKMNNN